MRIAMWSGPRNLSTALMYSFQNRSDFAVWDEPFYAPYLAQTGLAHPMADEIVAKHETNPATVAKRCLETISGQKPHFYMKHMPHHMIDGFPIDWAKSCKNVHLIRHPARVISSYGKKREEVSLYDIGFEQQHSIFKKLGGIVIDSADIRKNPEKMLRKLCEAISLPFDVRMLNWTAGARAEDGVWAGHWYNVVHKSTGFAEAEGPIPKLSKIHTKLLDAALPSYEELAKFKL